jgi:predicted AAA+ superfamily ATPase
MIDNSFKLDYLAARREIVRRLRQSPPGRIQLLTGPRQVGKTTLLLDLERRFKARAVYVACDGPDASLPGFWERAWSLAEERADPAACRCCCSTKSITYHAGLLV